MSHPWQRMPALDVNRAIARWHGTRHLGYRSQQAWSDVMFAFRQRGWHVTSMARCAARYVAMIGCTQRTACDLFGVDRSSISKAVREIATGHVYLR